MSDDSEKALANILDSKTAQKAYDDALSEAMSETGSALTDVVKTARLFTAPFQLAAGYQDRFRTWIDRVVRKVPEDRRVPAPARIAGPIFEELRYLDEGDSIAEMYLNLLSKAIDKERLNEAHPAFVKIIGQLSPDEALILHLLGQRSYEEHFESLLDQHKRKFHSKTIIHQEFPTDSLTYPKNFYVYTSHLTSLDLVAFPIYHQEPTWYDVSHRNQKGEIGRAKLHLTEFGSMFVRACEPDSF